MQQMSNISIANSSRHGMHRSQIPTNKEYTEMDMEGEEGIA
jgi:hypothetical protein